MDRFERSRWYGLAAVVTLIATAGGLASSSADVSRASPTVDSGPDSTSSLSAAQQTDSRVAGAVSFRRAVGLRSDSAYVVQMDAFRTAYPDAMAHYGMPLTDLELSELAARQELELAAPALADLARRIAPSSFAGIYIGKPATGQVYVGLTPDAPADVMSRLRASFAYPDRLTQFNASVSEAELSSDAERITADMSDLQKFGVDEVGIDFAANAVVVGAPTPTAELAKQLSQRYPNVRIQTVTTPQPVAASYIDDPAPPLHSGVKIHDALGFQCTAGFAAKRDASTNYFQLTDGHCGPPGDVWKHAQPTDPPYTIGPGRQNTYWGGGHEIPIDAQQIALQDSDKSNVIFLEYGFHQAIHDVEGQPDQGDIVCLSAWSSHVNLGDGQQCGLITVKQDAVTFTREEGGGDVQVHNLAKATYHSCRGDSGGPVYHNDSAKGLEEAVTLDIPPNCGTTSWLNQAGTVQHELGVHIYTG